MVRKTKLDLFQVQGSVTNTINRRQRKIIKKKAVTTSQYVIYKECHVCIIFSLYYQQYHTKQMNKMAYYLHNRI